jgi:hypothetical protein
MADYSAPVQTFSSPSYNVEPVVKRTGKGYTPLDMLEMVQTARGMTNLQKEQALLEPSIEAGKAASRAAIAGADTAEIGTNTARLENQLKHQNYASRQMLTLLNSDKTVTADDIKSTVTSIMKNSGAPDNAIKQALAALPAGGTDRENRAFIARHATNSLNAESQLEKLFPAAVPTNVGGAVIPMAGGGPLAYTAPGTQVGPATATTISPQLITDPVTQIQKVIGGGRAPGSQPQGGGPSYGIGGQPSTPVSQIGQPISAPTSQPQGQITAQPSVRPQTQTTSQIQGQTLNQPTNQGGGQLQPLEGEAPEQTKARQANVTNSYLRAQDQFNNPKSEFGHIPTIKNLNNNILTALKDPEVRTGAIENFLANKTAKETLTPKEQKLAKDLAQRIQGMGPRSDAAAADLKNAFGSMELKKETLTNLIRQDQAWVASEELKSRGVINNAGSGTKPNMQKVADFNNTFTQFANDPALMKYIAIIGENPDKANLDASDINDLKKEYGSMTSKQLQEMELKRKTLLRLVNGGK